MLAMWLMIGLSWGQARYTSEVIPLLNQPFRGDVAVSGVFDHYAVEGEHDNRQLTAWGTVTWGKSGHAGYDWPMPIGTPLLSAGDGVVSDAGLKAEASCPGTRVLEPLQWVRIVHTAPDGRRFATVYLHLSQVDVKVGDVVRAEQPIGLSGNTGCSTGPHLHFGVVALEGSGDKGPAVDPYGWDALSPDPRLVEGGKASMWLWRAGQAPLLYRTIDVPRSARREGDVVIGAFRGFGWKDEFFPNNEYVELRIGLDARVTTASLRGWTVSNLAGDTYTFPAGASLSVDAPMRLYSGQGVDAAQSAFWGRTSAAWDDVLDCVILRDPGGNLRSTIHHGRAADGACERVR